MFASADADVFTASFFPEDDDGRLLPAEDGGRGVVFIGEPRCSSTDPPAPTLLKPPPLPGVRAFLPGVGVLLRLPPPLLARPPSPSAGLALRLESLRGERRGGDGVGALVT